MGASAKGVKAGEAYVELHTRLASDFEKTLDGAKEKFKAWGESLRSVGAKVMAAGAGILTPLAGAVASAMGTAGQLADISAATGTSAESLSALGYAAKLTGVDLESLHGALRGMAKFTGQVAAGGKGATETLSKLGISSKAFLAATPEKRLAMIAEGLKGISDPGLRAAYAMKALGKSGEALIPMLAGGAKGLQEAAEEAQRLGLIVKSDDVEKLDALGDAWDTIGMQCKAAAVVVGSILAPALTKAAQFVQNLLAEAMRFIAANQSLVMVVAIAGAVLFAVGAAILSTGIAFAIASQACAAALAVWLAIPAIFAAIFSVAGLITIVVLAIAAALGVGIYWWLAFTQVGVLSCTLITQSARGMYAALSEGNWVQAAAINANLFQAIWAGTIFAVKSLFYSLGQTVLDIFSMIIDALQSLFPKLSAMVSVAIGAITAAGGQVSPQLAALAQVLGGAATAAGAKESIDALKKSLADKQAADASATIPPMSSAGVAAAAAQAEAEKKSKERADAWRKKMAGLLDATGGLMGGDAGEKFGTLGTFSGSVAGMLGRSQPNSHAERTAKATEKSAELLESIKGAFDDADGLLFES